MSAPRPDWELQPHGTDAAYRRHYRRGEKPCAACSRARALAAAERRKQDPEIYIARGEARRQRYRAVRQARPELGSREAFRIAGSRARYEQLMTGAA